MAKRKSSKKTKKSVKKKTQSESSEATPINWTKVGIVAALIIIVLFIHFRGQNQSADDGLSDVIQAASGDEVQVHYVGRHTNGTVFDTSREEVAREEGTYQEGRDYTPLKVVLGTGSVIAGFDEGIQGMAVGETKTISIPPEQGYGAYDESKVQAVPRVTRINRTIEVERVTKLTKDEFKQIFNEDPVIDQVYETEEVTWGLLVTDIVGNTVELEMDVNIGRQFTIPGAEWRVEVLQKTEDTVYLYQLPKKGSIVETPLGDGKVSTTDDEILITASPAVGSRMMSAVGPVTVKELTKDDVVLDMNHQLAGQTLEFEIELVSIN